MQSFKEFLKEDQEYNYPIVSISVNFNSYKGIDLSKSIGQEITERAFPYYEDLIEKGSEITCTSVGRVSIKTYIKQPGIVDTQDNFLRYIEKINLATKKFVDTEETKIPFPETLPVNVVGIPKIMVGTEFLKITCPKNFKLTDSEKTINCKTLRLIDPDNIVGNVLSLLKIPNLNRITTAMNINMNIHWLSYVNNQLQGDRDILECREELIEAGLKDFARF